jgi:hypothetical protein
VQTFVPLFGSADVAKVLDQKRLNKNALEGWQILMNLVQLDPQGNHRVSKGWSNHPAVKMWRGHEGALVSYILKMVLEWEKRGYKSTIGQKTLQTYIQAVKLGRITRESHLYPDWMRNREQFADIASSHRMALLSKDYEWYSQFGWPEDSGRRPDTYDYIWPVQ